MATMTQDDDLLIIEDDSKNESSGDIEFSFDFGDQSTPEATKASATQQETKAASVETSSTDTMESPEEALAALEKPEVHLDVAAESVETQTPVVEEQTEATLAEDFSFDLTEQETPAAQDTTSEIPETADTDIMGTAENVSSESSMNDILSATIAKLTLRQENIAKDKSWKTSQEEDLKTQIQELQDKVSQLESDMEMLSSEDEKITANIEELEKMKLNPVKEHNSKRSKK